MIGIFVLVLLGLWGLFAIWLGKLLSRKVFARFTTNATTGEATKKGDFITLLLIALVFLLPVLDQLIAYPKWQQLCSTTGDFEWGPGMDEKKAIGREVITKYENHQTTIFPNIKVHFSRKSVFDKNTNELIYKKPHYRFSARALTFLPSSSGSKSAPFLRACQNYSVMVDGIDYYRKIQVK